MTVATMPKPGRNRTPGTSHGPNQESESEAKEDGKKEVKKDETSLKVSLEDGHLVGKVATMRGLSVKKLFQMKDVNDFFTHLLLAEMKKEEERLKNRKS